MGLPSLNPSACIGKPVTIYALIDPRDKSAFYVGATTKQLGARLSSHLNDACHLRTRGGRCDVIRSIDGDKLRTQICELQVIKPEEWVEAEQFWIEYLRALGARLTNIGVGGPGALGFRQTKEAKLKRSLEARVRDNSAMHTPEVREKAASKLRHTIIVDGVRYDGIALAARALGLDQSTVHRRVDLGQYQRVTPRKNDNVVRLKGGRRRGAAHHNSKAIVIDGVLYQSMGEAMTKLGMSRQRVRKVLRSQ